MSRSTMTESGKKASVQANRTQRRPSPSSSRLSKPLSPAPAQSGPSNPALPLRDSVPRHPEAPARPKAPRVNRATPRKNAVEKAVSDKQPAEGNLASTDNGITGVPTPAKREGDRGAGGSNAIAPEVPDLVDQLRGLVEGANAGDKGALVALRRFLDQHPEVWSVCGDLGKVAERAWLDLLAKNDTLAQESVTRHLAQLKADLAGPEPLALEKLLVDEIGICYLAKKHAEITAASPPVGRWHRLLSPQESRECPAAFPAGRQDPGGPTGSPPGGLDPAPASIERSGTQESRRCRAKDSRRRP